MKRGRKPKSLQMKIVSGTFQAHKERRVNPDAPQAPAASAKAPAGLSKGELRRWNELALELRDAGLLTALDIPAFTMLVKNLALMDTADAALSKHGAVQKTKLGNLATSPWIRIRNSAQTFVLRIAGDFGLNPAARSRLRIEAPDPGIRRPNPVDEEEEAAIDEKFFGPKGA